MASSETAHLPTGFEPIDLDHAELDRGNTRLLEAVAAADPTESVLVLDALLDAYRAHFALEERLMEDTAYPLAARHREAHQAFLGDAAHHFALLEQDGLTASFGRWATGRLVAWFRLHVATNDVGLGLFLSARLPA